MNLIKVGAHSRATAVAGAIAGVIRQEKHAKVQAIGAGAVNQAVKAIAIARGFLKQENVHIYCVPEFTDLKITTANDEVADRTAIVFEVNILHQNGDAPLPPETKQGA
jgi:stage V sporulation protein S